MKPRLKETQGVVADKILDAMHESAEMLEDVGVSYALVGGLAVGAYGHPRATKDVDFILGPEAFDVSEGGVISFAKKIPLQRGTVTVDCIPAVGKDHLLSAIDEAQTSWGIRVAPVETVIYMKLQAGRRQDIADVERMIDAGADIKVTRGYLKTAGAKEELKMFEKLVAETEPV